MRAARKECRPLEHVLLMGPSGTGKTTMAHVLANAMDDELRVVLTPLTPKEMLRVLYDVGAGTILLDEFHSWPQRSREALYPLLDEGAFETRWGFERFDWLTIIATTTEKQMLSAPVLQRFPLQPRFEPYTSTEMIDMIERMVAKVGILLPDVTLAALADASSGMPRIARGMVFAARDLIAAGEPHEADDILSFVDLEADGLNADHLEYLQTLAGMGSQASLETLASLLQVHPAVLKTVERALHKRHYIVIESGRGRLLTLTGRRRLGIDHRRTA